MILRKDCKFPTEKKTVPVFIKKISSQQNLLIGNMFFLIREIAAMKVEMFTMKAIVLAGISIWIKLPPLSMLASMHTRTMIFIVKLVQFCAIEWHSRCSLQPPDLLSYNAGVCNAIPWSRWNRAAASWILVSNWMCFFSVQRLVSDDIFADFGHSQRSLENSISTQKLIHFHQPDNNNDLFFFAFNFEYNTFSPELKFQGESN